MVNTATNLKISLPGQQRGAVLAVTMIMLMTMTVIGISALSNTRMQETMASNVQEKTRVLQAADSGVIKAWMETEKKQYNTSVDKFDCDRYANGRTYGYATDIAVLSMNEELENNGELFDVKEDPLGVTGEVQYKMIGKATSTGPSGVANDARTPAIYFAWRSRAQTNATRAKAAVYMGVRIDGAVAGDDLYTPGTGEEVTGVDPC